MDWDTFFMSLAYLVAMKSKDRSTHVGCVIVDDENIIKTLGYNGFPRGVDDTIEERHDRPAKYLYTEHAERNAIYNARENLKGCRAFVNFLPCADCTRALLQSGIAEIVVHEDFAENYQSDKFDDSHAATVAMCRDKGIKITQYNGPIVTQITGFVGGKIMELNE